MSECSFISNSASSRGLAVAMTGSVDISGATFDGNEVHCASGLLYREDAEEVRGDGHQPENYSSTGHIRQQVPWYIAAFGTFAWISYVDWEHHVKRHTYPTPKNLIRGS